MCTRYANHGDVIAHARALNCHLTVPEWPRRYQVLPDEMMPVAIQDARSRRLGPMRWGWHRERLRGRPMTTGRGEVASGKDEFRRAFAARRCIVPMTAWYEWTNDAGLRLRWVMRDQVARTLFVAGLWETAKGAGDVEEGRFIILTVPAVPMLQKISARMPMLMPAFVIDEWLDAATTVARLRALAVPYQYEALEAYPANPYIDSNLPEMFDPITKEP